MRAGQRGTQMRLWTRKGTRPWMVHQQQSESAYIFVAVCPRQDSAVGLVMLQANTEAMAHHLAALSEAVPVGRHIQTGAVPERFIVAAARRLARTQSGRAGVAATARPVLGKPLLRRVCADSGRLLQRLECLHKNPPGTIRSLCSGNWSVFSSALVIS